MYRTTCVACKLRSTPFATLILNKVQTSSTPESQIASVSVFTVSVYSVVVLNVQTENKQTLDTRTFSRQSTTRFKRSEQL